MNVEDYVLVKARVKKFFDIDLNYYKDEQMKRRLDSWLARSQANTWQEYFNKISDNPREQDRFRNYLTINVTEFFRDPERWNTLRQKLIPHLLAEANEHSRAPAGLRVWSAGCSIGVEAYSLAILLEEAAAGSRHTILATDVHHGALQKSQAGGPYNQDETRNLTAMEKSLYFKGGPPYYVKDELIQKVNFKEHDLLSDEFETHFDLIVCRNVIIYFTNEAKTILYNKFFHALRRGGILFLGGTEIIPRPGEIGFKNLGISFYIKE